MTLVELEWTAIRPLSGSRANAFEELCAQLARAEEPSTYARFERKGTPDAGVECYAVLRDGSEWAWQAKYFSAMGASQWGQLDESVGTALEKHPRLGRYTVCLPIDLPDARLDGQVSASARWKDRVEKWTKSASAKGMTVRFELWGSSELLERLGRPEHRGRVRFWFQAAAFDEAWFGARLDEAVQAAGPRYTPEIHVGLPIADELDAFGRTPRFYDRLKATARDVRDALRSARYALGPPAADPAPESEAGATDAAAAAGAVAAAGDETAAQRAPDSPAPEEVFAAVEAALAAIAAVQPAPTSNPALETAATALATAEGAVSELDDALGQRSIVTSVGGGRRGPQPRDSHERRRELRYRLGRLERTLRESRSAFEHGAHQSDQSLLVLTGVAGHGKTHLVCDVARQRLAAGQPTVLLMGQRFVSTEDPWAQALQHLDLATTGAEEFVGALEAAAEAAGARALVIVDALNEGAGRRIWPSHLGAFLARLERSAWIGVVLTIRTSYQDAVMPAEVLARAYRLQHDGFADHEYDATRTFFPHYGIELPSTPLLAPEFRSPLFLKTLCRGLQESGQRRLPRGFHGITEVFGLYFNATNVRLARDLSYNPRHPHVRNALQALAREMVDAGDAWVPLSRAEALVDAILPGRDYDRSLYHGLVAEGLLIEDAGARYDGGHSEDVVVFGYERFGDHLMAAVLLDRHLDPQAPAEAFRDGGPIPALWGAEAYFAPGLLEALCIQVPERTGRELAALAPAALTLWGHGEAFRQSLVWRSANAVTDETVATLNAVEARDGKHGDTLDVLLTVATLPGHRLNAEFLDRHLRRFTMPDRDTWWSTYLHRAWGARGAVDRLVEWAAMEPTRAPVAASRMGRASTPDPTSPDDVLYLCATAITWMLSTANRFLRDRATTALVALLAESPDAAASLVDRFADVDDPYVRERVYAVAYGVAMRSADPDAVGRLATRVYAHVFAPQGGPPSHILLRDYARGVVERALSLRAPLEVEPQRVRPPYRSVWPTIPTEQDLVDLLAEPTAAEAESPARDADWGYDTGNPRWSLKQIEHSVMRDDFARYVIGTNTPRPPWLDLPLDAPLWKSPEERLDDFAQGLSPTERRAWDVFREAHDAVLRLTPVRLDFGLDPTLERGDGDDEAPADTTADTTVSPAGEPHPDDQLERAQDDEELPSPELQAAQDRLDAATAALEEALTAEHASALYELVEAGALGHERYGRPPRIDLATIQRYVLRRVLDLGWTVERFGRFDRDELASRGREAHKAERIGKKYQWIAYHEILALIADHFQYYGDDWGVRAVHAYDGPWQEGLRDIDPSTTLRALRGSAGWGAHTPAWWAPAAYGGWSAPADARDWVRATNDLPSWETLVLPTEPHDDTAWCALQGAFNWRQTAPSDRATAEVAQGEIWYQARGYFVRREDQDAFMAWAKRVDFWGQWMPGASEVHGLFLGEYGWAPASRHFGAPPAPQERWRQPKENCPVRVRVAGFEYWREGSGFDCAVDDSYRLFLPPEEFVSGLRLRWHGLGADFLTPGGQLVATDPAAHVPGPNTLLLRRDVLWAFLEQESLTLCWTLLGEKRILPAETSDDYSASQRLSGACTLTASGLRGFVKHRLFEEATRSSRLPTTRIGDTSP